MMKLNMKTLAVSLSAAILLSGCAESINKPAVIGEGATGVAQNYELSGDFLFDFNQSTLSAQGEQVLSNMATDLQQSGATQIKVAGYTDYLGSNSYNQRLSQARAETVKAYLQQAGVSANIEAVGMGEADQVKACPGLSGSALKECLKPNRRVRVMAN